jgi:hypothetical protein
MRKPTRVQLEALEEVMTSKHGCLQASAWVSGTKRYCTLRAVPLHCAHMPVERALRLPGLSGRQVRALVRDWPRTRKVVVVTHRRAANQAMRLLKEKRNEK